MERDLKLNQTVQTRQERDYSILFFFQFLFDNFFIYISNVNHFPTFLSKNPLSYCPTPANQPTLSGFLALVFYSGIELSQDEGPLLSLMTD